MKNYKVGDLAKLRNHLAGRSDLSIHEPLIIIETFKNKSFPFYRCYSLAVNRSCYIAADDLKPFHWG